MGSVCVWVCIYNICYHVAACVIPFKLICNMTNILKKLNFHLFTPPLGLGVGGGQLNCYHATMLLNVSFPCIVFAT